MKTYIVLLIRSALARDMLYSLEVLWLGNMVPIKSTLERQYVVLIKSTLARRYAVHIRRTLARQYVILKISALARQYVYSLEVP